MSRRFSGRVVAITGAATGIGRAAALEFARGQASLILIGRRQAALERLARECERLGARALAIGADVTDEAAVQAAARQAVERFGRIDVWVNNAAVTLFGRLEEVPIEAIRRVIDTNLFGYIHGARAAIPIFRGQGRGVLINVSSVVGKIGSPFVSAYVASKFAIVGLSESLRMELRDAPGIRVCTVLPASIDTPLFQHGANYTGRAAQPLKPIYPPELVARAIVRAAERPRREVVVGAAGEAALALHAVAPGLSEKLAARRVEKQHFQDQRAVPGPGNIFEPDQRFESTCGGWRPASRVAGKPALILGSLVALGLAVLARSLRRRTYGGVIP